MDSEKRWNWQQDDWPQFRFERAILQDKETKFLFGSGILLGAFRHIGEDDKNDLIVDLISDEAVKTSEIEGEFLNRGSVQSSIRRIFGLVTDRQRIPSA
jgi:Fic family protein